MLPYCKYVHLFLLYKRLQGDTYVHTWNGVALVVHNLLGWYHAYACVSETIMIAQYVYVCFTKEDNGIIGQVGPYFPHSVRMYVLAVRKVLHDLVNFLHVCFSYICVTCVLVT